MARTFLRQDTQIRNSDLYDDTLAAGSTLETGQTEIEGDLNALRSQVKRLIWDDASGNWYDDIPTFNGKKRAIRDLNFDLDELESQKCLCRETLLTDVAVPALQNWVILSAASSETPGTVAAVALTQDGAVLAQSALNGAGFDVWEDLQIAGPVATQPKNLMVVRNATDGQVIQSSGRDIFALLEYESTGVDGAAFDDVSGGNRAKLSFMRLNAGLDDLEACPVGDIAGKTINYSYVQRYQLDDLPEDCFLTQSSFIDFSGTTSITRQTGYDNQGTTPVELATHAFLDLGATREWTIRDDANASLFRIVEGSGGGTTAIQLTTDVDTFDVNALVNDFDQGIRVDSGGQRINIGETAGLIESTSGNDLRILGAGEMYLDDGNQTGSTWAQTAGIKLSDTTVEWDNYETAFGEVSLLQGIYLAYNRRKTKVYANVTLTTSANTDVGGVGGGTNLDTQLPNMVNGDFSSDYDVFLNGNLLRPGADASANNDYYPGTSLTNGQLRFEFNVKVNDVLCVIPYA